MSLEPFMKKAIKVALSEGASEVEVFGSRSRTLSLYVDDDKIKNMEEKSDQGIAVRVIRAKRIGQSSISISSIRDAERCANIAMKLAAASYDKVLASMTPDQLSQLAKDVIAGAIDGGGVKIPNGVIRAAVIQHMVVNTNGTETDQHSTMLYAHMTSMTEGKEPGEGVNQFFSPHLDRFEPVAFGTSLAKKAKAAQKAKHFQGKRTMSVILPPEELGNLLGSSAIYALNAENVYRKRSAWAKKMGEMVASPKLTFTDDPFDERGMCSCAYDDEGSQTMRQTLVDRGMLKGFVYDQYNALLMGKKSTGNSLRRMPNEVQNIYRVPLDISPINFVIEQGSKSVAQMTAEMDHGLVIEKLASAEANPITGAFGLEIRCAHLIEKGVEKGTVDHALLIGNMFQMLHQVRDVGNDATVHYQSILPSIAFDGLEIIGQ
jgi:predicted Zn-dependent protease